MSSIARAETSVDLGLVFGILGIVAFLIWKGSAILSGVANFVSNAAGAAADAVGTAYQEQTNATSDAGDRLLQGLSGGAPMLPATGAGDMYPQEWQLNPPSASQTVLDNTGNSLIVGSATGQLF